MYLYIYSRHYFCNILNFSFQIVIVETLLIQMVLTATEAGVDDTVTLEGGSLINSALNEPETIVPHQIQIPSKKQVVKE